MHAFHRPSGLFISALVVAACLVNTGTAVAQDPVVTVTPASVPANASTTVTFALQHFPADTTIQLRSPLSACPARGIGNLSYNNISTDATGSASDSRNVDLTRGGDRKYDSQCTWTASVVSQELLH